MKWCIVPILLMLLLVPGCIDKTGDVLLLPDGSVLEGRLLSMENGLAIFSEGSAEVPAYGRIWTEEGATHAGLLSFSSGIIRAGSVSVPLDSATLVVLGDTTLSRGFLTLDASTGWTETGVSVARGDMLSLFAEGLIVSETGRSAPDGNERYSSSVALVPGAVPGQLVFRIGDGIPVAAGSMWTGRSPDTGELRLAVNIPVEGSHNARGTYSVMVITGPGSGSTGFTALFPSGR